MLDIIEDREVREVREVLGHTYNISYPSRNAAGRAGARAGSNHSPTSRTSLPKSCFDHELARKIARRVVSRKRQLFAATSAIGVDDLIAAAVQRIWLMHDRFDERRAKYTTWAYRVASFAIIDLYRASSRQLRSSQVERRAPVGRPTLSGVVELAETALRASRSLQPPMAGAGRPGAVPYASRVAIAAVRDQEGWSARETAWRLRDDSDLRRALGIGKVPHYTAFSRAFSRVAKLRRITPEMVQSAICVAGVAVVPFIIGKDRVKLVTTKQASNILGVSQSTLRAWRKRRRYLPYRRLGGAVVYDVRDIEEYLQKTRVACN